MHMKKVALITTCLTFAVVLAVPSDGQTDEKDTKKFKNEGFVELLDGKTLSGWKALENADSWSVLPDGSVRGKGKRSHLFSLKEYTDVHFRADIKTAKGSNGGLYVRTTKTAKFPFPPAYEAQVNNTAPAKHRTGSLYIIAGSGRWTTPVQIKQSPVSDNEWWTEEIIVKTNHIVIRVNGKTVVDYVDKDETHTTGYLALQLHDPRSVVYYKNVMVKDLSKRTRE